MTEPFRPPTVRECLKCGSACCRYVLWDLPREPRSQDSLDEVIWMLGNPHIRILKNGRRWSILVEGRCRMLDGDGCCQVYERRPFICQDYPDRDGQPCHGDDLGRLEGRMFSDPLELLEYLAVERGKEWAAERLEVYRRVRM